MHRSRCTPIDTVAHDLCARGPHEGEHLWQAWVRTCSRRRPTAAAPHADRLSAEELHHLDAYWHACNYLASGMIYLQANPLRREPLQPEHVKRRLLGHWGSSPGLSFAYIPLNRLITKYDLDAIFRPVLAPAHAPAGKRPIHMAGRCAWVRG